MISMAINAVGIFASWLSQMETKTSDKVNLPAKISSISERQDFNIPTFAVESQNFKGDTIYKLPLVVEVRYFVSGSKIDIFEFVLENMQFSENFIEIKGLHGKTYKNLKVVGWARDTTSEMVGAAYYNVSFQEVRLIEALAGLSNKANAATGGVSSKGNVVAQEATPQSVLYKGFFK